MMKIQPFQRDEHLGMTFPVKIEQNVPFLNVQIHNKI